MIVDSWWMNLIAIILIVALFVCTLVLYLHMNPNQQKESRNIALLATGAVTFGLVLIILVADVIVEYSRDKRSAGEIKRDQLTEKSIIGSTNKTPNDKYGTPRQ